MPHTAQELRRLLRRDMGSNPQLLETLLDDPGAAVAVFRQLGRLRADANQRVGDVAHAAPPISLSTWREASAPTRASSYSVRRTVRFFFALLSWAPLGLGFLWQLWDRDKLAWHDRISGTRLRHYPKPKN